MQYIIKDEGKTQHLNWIPRHWWKAKWNLISHDYQYLCKSEIHLPCCYGDRKSIYELTSDEKYAYNFEVPSANDVMHAYILVCDRPWWTQYQCEYYLKFSNRLIKSSKFSRKQIRKWSLLNTYQAICTCQIMSFLS